MVETMQSEQFAENAALPDLIACRALHLAEDDIAASFDPDSPRNRRYRMARLLQGRARRRARVTHYLSAGDARSQTGSAQAHRSAGHASGFQQLLAWLSDYPAPRDFVSLDEALAWHRAQLSNQKLRRDMAHWSCRPERIPLHREKIIVARYFARFGFEIWERQAA